ncbi:hypothetical protein [Vreelandella rituensis]|uniref:Uncharacterized protein n=1 Tax=Vreelandella rituensis TaxID=2282306 RepID=A0A368UAT2_9GAMM|nr:hypothetical protein [Halomonas rituensis]RCV93627.1 hypothetical protein DU506_00285 [Halomonas rituensis]
MTAASLYPLYLGGVMLVTALGYRHLPVAVYRPLLIAAVIGTAFHLGNSLGPSGWLMAPFSFIGALVLVDVWLTRHNQRHHPPLTFMHHKLYRAARIVWRKPV